MSNDFSPQTRHAVERIQQAFSPELFDQLSQQWQQTLANHLRHVLNQKSNVLNWVEPLQNIQLARQHLAGPAVAAGSSEQVVQRFIELLQTSLDRGHNLHHPHYIGHQVPAPVPFAGLFDALGSVTNQVMAIYEMGPWVTALETALIEEVGQQLGFPENSFAGLVTHGGSLANLTAMLTARNVALKNVWNKGFGARSSQPVLIAHADAHYSIARVAGLLGIGTDQLVKARLDDNRRIDPLQLDQLLARLEAEGRPVVAVAACSCATPIGAFDNLEKIADVCEKHAVWLHVDAAHGGAAAFSDRHRHLLKGLQRADSVVCDAHKMMFVPALCAFVFYKNKNNSFETFQQNAPYLFDPSDPGMAVYDSGMKTVECTKRAAAIGLWGVWSLLGKQIFADLVDVTFELGQIFYRKLVDATDFEPLHQPQCNIQVFRYLPEKMRHRSPEEIGQFQRDLRRQLIRSGQFYIVQTDFSGTGALRVAIMNPTTTPVDFDILLEKLRELGNSLP